ncbi:DMT family transporter [Gorillibacterium sp. sgz5001074]|uniref:DMT family transporter n=1 Tax=Gorillibacterium sp. sgz5001074 TaxID=3446695 RepID=UPI003F667405
MKTNTVWYAVGLMLVAAIWGTNFGVSRLAMDTFDPVLFTFIRFGGAVPFFFLLLKWKEGSIGIDWRSAGQLALIGLFGVTGLEIIVMYSIKYTSLANASLLNVAPWPIFAALFAPLFTKERITKVIVIGGGIALAGVALVILGGEEGLDLSAGHMLGNLMAFSASIVGALYNLASMPLMRKYSALRVSTWTIVFGAAFMLPLTWGSWSKVDWAGLGSTEYTVIFYNVLVSTVIAFLMWNACMFKVGATKSNFFRYVVPAAAVVAGYLMYDEKVLLLQMLGALFMAAGLVVIQLEKPRT